VDLKQAHLGKTDLRSTYQCQGYLPFSASMAYLDKTEWLIFQREKGKQYSSSDVPILEFCQLQIWNCRHSFSNSASKRILKRHYPNHLAL
jgi:hypothetical protein